MDSSLVGSDMLISGMTVRVQSKLAEGAMGLVYKASCGGRPVVLKVMVLQNKQQLAVAQKEARILEELRGRGFVQMVARDGKPRGPSGHREMYILLEYCSRGTLLEQVQRLQKERRHFTTKQLLSVFGEVTAAVVAMHARDPPMAHRDLKLENVLVTTSGRYVLCDFGSVEEGAHDIRDASARIAEEELIERYTTGAYRAPEMVDLYSKPVIDEKVDVWALGCMLFTMAFQEHPFAEAGNLGILSGKFAFPASSRYPAGVHDLIEVLLDVDSATRPSAEAAHRFAAALFRDDTVRLEEAEALRERKRAARAAPRGGHSAYGHKKKKMPILSGSKKKGKAKGKSKRGRSAKRRAHHEEHADAAAPSEADATAAVAAAGFDVSAFAPFDDAPPASPVAAAAAFDPFSSGGGGGGGGGGGAAAAAFDPFASSSDAPSFDSFADSSAAAAAAAFDPFTTSPASTAPVPAAAAADALFVTTPSTPTSAPTAAAAFDPFASAWPETAAVRSPIGTPSSVDAFGFTPAAPPPLTSSSSTASTSSTASAPADLFAASAAVATPTAMPSPAGSEPLFAFPSAASPAPLPFAGMPATGAPVSIASPHAAAAAAAAAAATAPARPAPAPLQLLSRPGAPLPTTPQPSIRAGTAGVMYSHAVYPHSMSPSPRAAVAAPGSPMVGYPSVGAPVPSSPHLPSPMSHASHVRLPSTPSSSASMDPFTDL